jgi:hypothetical protein
MTPRQSSKSLATRTQTALPVAIAPTIASRDAAALVSERNFYKNKTRLLERDLASVQALVASGGANPIEATPQQVFDRAMEQARAGATTSLPAPARNRPQAAAVAVAVAIPDEIASRALHHASVLQRQAANHQLAMARAEVRMRREADRADALALEFTALKKLQRSPPYRIAKRVSRWGRFWKRLGRRLTSGTR